MGVPVTEILQRSARRFVEVGDPGALPWAIGLEPLGFSLGTWATVHQLHNPHLAALARPEQDSARLTWDVPFGFILKLSHKVGAKQDLRR